MESDNRIYRLTDKKEIDAFVGTIWLRNFFNLKQMYIRDLRDYLPVHF